MRGGELIHNTFTFNVDGVKSGVGRSCSVVIVEQINWSVGTGEL
eukprot:COSAG02_NODE_3192_length_7198_cov_6.275046_6_plen_44_part_00